MKVFNVRLDDSVPKSNKPIQISCDDRAAWRVAMILQNSEPVVAFNLEGDDGMHVNPHLTKFKKNLFERELHEQLVFTLVRMQERVDKEFGGCLFESFVGSPGDCSPPHCNCERCIAAGRAYRYESFNVAVTPIQHEYFKSLLIREAGTKNYRWGLEFRMHLKCCISVYNQGTMSVCSNKPQIRIGVYVYDHKEKAWSKS